MKKVDSGNGRRRLFRAGLSALAAGLLLKLVGSERVVVERVHGADGSALVIGAANTGSLTTILSSPVSNGAAAFFDNAGSGDAQAIQGRSQSPSGRGLVGFASAPSGRTIAVDGVVTSPEGIGLRGVNTATNGNAVGVQGQTESPLGSIFLGLGPSGVERFRVAADGGVNLSGPGLTILRSGFVSLSLANLGTGGSTWIISSVGDLSGRVGNFEIIRGLGYPFNQTVFSVTPAGSIGIGTTDPAGLLHLAGDMAKPLVIDKSIVPAAAPGAGKGMLRWEPGTNAGTLKLVAYSGTSIAGVTIVDNVGSGN